MIQLLDIEKELAGPDGQAALEKYDQTLVALDGRLADVLRQGLSPVDYSGAENLQKAVVIARKLLRLAMRDVGQGS